MADYEFIGKKFIRQAENLHIERNQITMEMYFCTYSVADIHHYS